MGAVSQCLFRLREADAKGPSPSAVQPFVYNTLRKKHDGWLTGVIVNTKAAEKARVSTFDIENPGQFKDYLDEFNLQILVRGLWLYLSGVSLEDCPVLSRYAIRQRMDDPSSTINYATTSVGELEDQKLVKDIQKNIASGRRRLASCTPRKPSEMYQLLEEIRS